MIRHMGGSATIRIYDSAANKKRGGPWSEILYTTSTICKALSIASTQTIRAASSVSPYLKLC